MLRVVVFIYVTGTRVFIAHRFTDLFLLLFKFITTVQSFLTSLPQTFSHCLKLLL